MKIEKDTTQTGLKGAGAEEHCSRPYRLGQRETAMEAVRIQILAAARELILGDKALSGFSIEAVARQAGVTRVTVYGRFGSKRGLLEALFDEMGTQGRLHERLPVAFSQPDAVAALKTYVETFCDFWARDRLMKRRLSGFAALDQEFAAAIASRYERRHQAWELLISRLNGQGLIPPPNEREQLVQTLLALTGFEFYDALAGERLPSEVSPQVFYLVQAALGLKP